MKSARLILLSVFAAALAVDVRCEDVAGPIPVSPDATTLRDDFRADTEWMRRVMVAPFEAGLKGDPWDVQALEFVKNGVEHFRARDGMLRKALIPQGKAVIDAGCADPLVLYLWSKFEAEFAGHDRGVRATLDKAIKSLPETKYPKAVWWTIGMFRRNAGLQKPAFDEQLAGWMAESLSDGSFRKDAHDFMCVRRFVSLEAWEILPEKLAAAVKASDLPEWARETLLGICEQKIGWLKRGGGWASEVTDDGWKGFAEHLEVARGHLKKAWELRPDRHEAAANMISIVMAGHGFEGDSLRKWFDRAVQAQLDTRQPYWSMSWALRPRWGGSHEEMLAFARACRAAGRYDTELPVLYLEILRHICEDAGDWKPVFAQPGVAKEVIAVCEGLMDEPSRRDERARRRQFLGLFACLTKNPGAAAKSLGEPLGEFYPEVKESAAFYGFDEEGFRSNLEALGSPGAADFIRAEEKFEAGKYNDAERLFRSAVERAAGKTPALITRRLATIATDRELAAGDWVKMKPDLATWRVQSGDWSVTPDGTLVNTGHQAPGMILLPARPGENFEMRGEIAVESPGANDRDFGVLLAVPERVTRKWISCQVYQEGRGKSRAQIFVITASWQPSGEKSERKTHLPGEVTRFLVQAWNGRINYYLDGKPIAAGFESESRTVPTAGTSVGFGTWEFARGNTTRFRNIELRRLTAEPSPPKED